jgi:hypothetical protein
VLARLHAERLQRFSALDRRSNDTWSQIGNTVLGPDCVRRDDSGS